MSSRQEEKPKDINTSGSSALEALGFDAWFAEQSAGLLEDGFAIARVIEVNKSNYKVSTGRHDILAELSGRFLFNVDNRTELPTVGDWVVVQCFDEDGLAIIHHILPRKSLLRRKDPGKAVAFQLIAANIDFAFIVQSADANFNLHRLERYLVMVHESKIAPMVILSKTDLLPAEQLAGIQEQVKPYQDKYPFLAISNVTGDGLQKVREVLQSGKTYCLLGSSGVGKTTLLNNLLGEALYEVNAVREKDSRGRHTTSKRQLVRLPDGSIFIDTPGMRELGNFNVDAGLEETFDEIASLQGQCHFADCTHRHEAGCAVIAAVQQGLIDHERYQNYLKIQKESAYYAMSYQDKRKKDKQFGKMVKDYKKSIRKK